VWYVFDGLAKENIIKISLIFFSFANTCFIFIYFSFLDIYTCFIYLFFAVIIVYLFLSKQTYNTYNNFTYNDKDVLILYIDNYI
jgi:hypothetical protein